MGKLYFNSIHLKKILFLLILFLGFNSSAQHVNINENGILNRSEIDPRQIEKDPFFGHALRARPFNLNANLKNANAFRKGQKIDLDIFSDKRFESTVIKKHTDINGITVITLKLDQFEYAYGFITISPRSYLLSLQIPENNEKFISKYHPRNKKSYLLSINPKKEKIIDGCGVSKNKKVNKNPFNAIPTKDEQYGETTNPDVTEGEALSINYCANPDGSDQTVIDVMIIYSNEAEVYANENEGGINNTIAASIAYTNNISANSALGITFNLVYSGPANFSDVSGNSSEHFKFLNEDGDGKMDEVHSIREQVGADLVGLFTFNADYAGIANLLTDRYGDKSLSFSLTNILYASNSHVLAHEFGHNLGASHTKYQKFQAGPTIWENWAENTWSGGWRWRSNDGVLYSSVMSYNGGSYFEDNETSVTVPYFSDDDRFYLGGQMGNEFEANNTLTIQETKSIIKNYSDSYLYCQAGSANAEPAGIEHVVLGNIDNYTSKEAYSDFSGIATCVYPQDIINSKIKVSGVSEAKELLIWVDWNNDKTFDNSTELVYQSTNNNTEYNTGIQVPSTIEPGIKRIRIRLHDTEFNANSEPCGESEFGEVEDYAINVLEQVNCTLASVPGNVKEENIQSNGFQLSWDIVEGISEYEIRYKMSSESTWTEVNSIYYTEYEFSELIPETQYEVQVRSRCSASEASEFSVSKIVTTNASLRNLEFSEAVADTEIGVSIPPVTINILDVYGTLSNSDAKVELRLIDTYSTGAKLEGFSPKRATNGSVVFDNLKIDKMGRFSLEAFIDGLPPISSNEFSVIEYSSRTYIVNTTLDSKDKNLLDDTCADKDGNCSLRAAIQNANKTFGKDIVNFNIPGEGPHKIYVDAILPKIKAPIELNAMSQPGFQPMEPKIIVSGENIPVIDHDESLPVIPRNEQATCFDLIYKSSGSTIKGFVLGGFGKKYDDVYHSGSAISIQSTTGHVIQGNFIGVDADGETALPNIWGIVVGEPETMDGNNLIGGANSGDRNIISGNIADGIHIGYYGNLNKVIGNYIGVDKSGSQALGNKKGVSIGVWAYNNTLNDNLISGNEVGVEVRTDDNIIINNKIGTDLNGTFAIPNISGIQIFGDNNHIGRSGEGNLISGNSDSGIYLTGNYNFLKSNSIGYNNTGDAAVPNSKGVYIGGNYNEIGSTQAGTGNFISGNNYGIYVSGAYNKMHGNKIGLSKNNNVIPNVQVGIFINGSDNSIGGLNPSEENIIAYNTTGVGINYATTNKISGNSIFENQIGIDLQLDGSTRNDREDSDYGANNLQNFPELSNPVYDGNLLDLNYILDSKPEYSAYPINVELFIGDGNSQGKKYIGSFSISEYVSLKGNNKLTVSTQLKPGIQLSSGDLIVATATDAEGNTSEFGNEVSVTVTGSCTPETWYADSDGDGLGDTTVSIEECSATEGYVSNSDDCDDTDPQIGALTTWFFDSDGDGFGDPAISVEECIQRSDYVIDNTDCDDSNLSIYPGALDDTVDGVDQDCDGIDGPVPNCQGADTLLLTEECSTDTNVFWNISNPGTCEVNGRWELRKNSSTGASSGTFSISGGESVQVVSGTVSKGKTQIIIYWNDSNGLELSTSTNASGINCTSAASLKSEENLNALTVAPNPVNEGIGMHFTAVDYDTVLEAAVYDLSGSLLAMENFNIQAGTNYLHWNLDHTSWIKGTYILNVKIADKTYQTKFIK